MSAFVTGSDAEAQPPVYRSREWTQRRRREQHSRRWRRRDCSMEGTASSAAMTRRLRGGGGDAVTAEWRRQQRLRSDKPGTESPESKT